MKEENLPQLARVMRVFLDSVGPERIVWGTDLPQAGVGSRSRAQTQAWTDFFKTLPESGAKYGVTFTEEERDGICHGARQEGVQQHRLRHGNEAAFRSTLGAAASS